MQEYVETMKKRASVLKKAIEAAEKDQKRFPEGRLRISKSGKQIRYYHVIPSGDSIGTYITRDKHEIVKVLAQKDYARRFISAAIKELSRL